MTKGRNQMAYNPYSDEQRNIAIEIVRRMNGNVKKALPDVRQQISSETLGANTLRRWYNAAEDGDPRLNPKKVTATCPHCGKSHTLETAGDAASDALKTQFHTLSQKALAHASKDAVIADLDGLQATKVAAIAVDKMRLLDGLPTEIIKVMPDLLDAFEAAGFDPAATIEAMIRRAREAAHGRST